MHVNEKLDPIRAEVRRIKAFCAHVKQCGFIDLGYSGPAYTWTNKRFSTNPTYDRLDRCLGNAKRFRTRKHFRFKNWWLMEQDYHRLLTIVGNDQLLDRLLKKQVSLPLTFAGGEKESRESLIN